MINFTDINYTIGNTLQTCEEQIKECVQRCADFHVNVSDIMNARFRWGFILLSVIIFYKFFVGIIKPKYAQSHIYKEYIEFSVIEWGTLMLTMILIFILFFV